MNWTQLLQNQIASAYSTTAKLMEMVDAGNLDWKPQSGSNWMTMGQLLKHLSEACGPGCRGFVTGDWGLPEGKQVTDLPPEEMMPPAEKLPAVSSVDEARRLLAEDKKLALEMIDLAGEDALTSREVATPWNPAETAELGRQLLLMVQHMERHKGQLFYYLKLQGKPVNTVDLWG